MENNKYQIINLNNKMNINNIFMIELCETLLPIIHMKAKKMIIKVAFIVEYQPSPENMFS